MKELLNATFPEVSKESWLKQLEKDLKGTSIQDALYFNDSIEELDFKSHYHWSEDTELNAEPYSPTRSFHTNNNWVIYQQIDNIDAKTANQSALENLTMGCDGIGFSTINELQTRIKDVQLEYIYADFTAKSKAEVEQILKFLPVKKNVTFVCDPLTNGSTDEIIPIFTLTKSIEGVKSFEINNALYAAAGANISQQLGVVCAQVKAYFEILTEAGEDANVLADNIQLNIGIGANYLHEIAKFRALRLLLDTILEAYGVTAGKQIRIKAQSLFLNKSLEDPYTNLLRLTTEGMSAALGGADILHLQPYDAWSEKGATSFTYRMSNNISNILKEESFFNQVVDAAGGTYAIEKSTNILAEAGWSFFQTIEKNGGFIAAQPIIEAEISRISQKRIELMQNKQMKFIGLNIFANPDNAGLKWKVPSRQNISPLILELHKEGGQR